MGFRTHSRDAAPTPESCEEALGDTGARSFRVDIDRARRRAVRRAEFQKSARRLSDIRDHRTTAGLRTSRSSRTPPDYIFPLVPGEYFTVANTADFQSLLYEPLYWFGDKASTVDRLLGFRLGTPRSTATPIAS